MERAGWTPFERDCLQSLEDKTPSEASSSGEDDAGGSGSGAGGVPSSGALWDDYEGTALAIARLYQAQGWREFQAAAAASTQLYKDSVEATRRAAEAGRAAGRGRLVKELLGYLRTQRGPFLRRQDLVAFLAGRSPPPHGHRAGSLASSPVLMSRLDALRLASPAAAKAADPEGLRMFGQALAIHAPDGKGSSPTASGAHRANSPRRQQLQRFFLDQVRRHRKRSAEEREDSGSPPDSPAVAKRQRRL